MLPAAALAALIITPLAPQWSYLPYFGIFPAIRILGKREAARAQKTGQGTQPPPLD